MPGCYRTCINNIHTNVVDQTLISGVISDKISHHHPIFTLIELSPDSVPTPDSSDKITIHYDYSNANLEKLCLEIENDVDRFHHSCNTFDSFMQLFQEKIDLSCKLLTPRTTKRNSITNPWITQGLINSSEKKARLYFEWKKTCTLKLPDGDPNKHIYYKEFDKFLKRSINMAKAMCYNRKFEKYSMNSKKTWEVINELCGKNLSRCKDDFVIDGQRVTCRRIIANKFCEYFTSLASNLNKNVLSNNSISLEPVESFAQFMSNSVSDSIYLEETNKDEIVEVIRDFQNGKASDIPIIVVKNRQSSLLVPWPGFTTHVYKVVHSQVYLKLVKLFLFTRKTIRNAFKIIGLYQYYLYLEKSLKRSFTNAFIISSHLKVY